MGLVSRPEELLCAMYNEVIARMRAARGGPPDQNIPQMLEAWTFCRFRAPLRAPPRQTCPRMTSSAAMTSVSGCLTFAGRAGFEEKKGWAALLLARCAWCTKQADAMDLSCFAVSFEPSWGVIVSQGAAYVACPARNSRSLPFIGSKTCGWASKNSQPLTASRARPMTPLCTSPISFGLQPYQIIGFSWFMGRVMCTGALMASARCFMYTLSLIS
mmetsp:Transcript_25795/g.48551  ORF Transcript_25795/g.48551 Transcript_25795/m.48551 type:complete len:215 (+) Transcript_25795:8828-9472(+)